MADESDIAINAFQRTDGSARWNEYKGSIKWFRLKDLALDRAGHRCEWIENQEDIPASHHLAIKLIRCKNRRKLEMHHLYYPDNPDDDCLDNVEILCQKHHREAGGYD